MKLLVLGGTAWLGRELAGQAVARGHEVTCLARGAQRSGSRRSGAGPRRSRPGRGIRLARAARVGLGGRALVAAGMVRAALAALAGRAAHWIYISSRQRLRARTATLAADESCRSCWRPLAGETATREQYGEAKVACEQASSEAIADRLLIARAGLIGGPGDHTDRSGYWPARAARERRDPMLVPDSADRADTGDRRPRSRRLAARRSRGRFDRQLRRGRPDRRLRGLGRALA